MKIVSHCISFHASSRVESSELSVAFLAACSALANGSVTVEAPQPPRGRISLFKVWLNKDPKKNSDPWKTPEGTIAGSFSLCSHMFWNCQRFGKLVFSIELWSVPSSMFVWTPNQYGQPAYLLPKHTYHSWGHSCSPASVAWLQVVGFSVACFPSTHTGHRRPESRPFRDETGRCAKVMMLDTSGKFVMWW